MNHVLSVLQILGALAVLVGVWLLLPLAPALIADGALVVVAATAVEVAARKAHSAPSVRRGGPSTGGGV